MTSADNIFRCIFFLGALRVKHIHTISKDLCNTSINNIEEDSRDLYSIETTIYITGCVAQSVTCLTADPGVASSILVRSHTFVEIDHEIISTAILLPSADSRRVVVSYKQKYVHEGLVNLLVKLPRKKVWLGELAVPP